MIIVACVGVPERSEYKILRGGLSQLHAKISRILDVDEQATRLESVGQDVETVVDKGCWE